jgi:hypothetical protein
MRAKLLKIQTELKAPKNQRNSHGNYNYRSCEDILEAVKPLCLKYNCVLTLSDRIINVGEFNYIESTVTLNDLDSEKSVFSTAIAREAVIQKGMHEAQITGSTSSYSRKYALNGLFSIDDTKDDDTKELKKEEPKKEHGNQKAIIEAINKKSNIKELDDIIQKRTQYEWTITETMEQNEAMEKVRNFIKEAK